MPWNAYVLVLAIAFLLQTAVVRLLGFESIDLLFALALFGALTAPLHDARLAAFWAGMAEDLGSGGLGGAGGPIGAGAFAFGVSGLIVTWLREIANVQIWWVRLVVAFLGALPGQILLAIYGRVWLELHPGSIWLTIVYVLVLSFVSALMAAGLTSLPLFLGWDRRRRRSTRPRW